MLSDKPFLNLIQGASSGHSPTPHPTFSAADATAAERKEKEQNLFITDIFLNLSATGENSSQLL